MNFGNTNDAVVNLTNSNQGTNSNVSGDLNNPSRFKRLMERSRLTEEDLEEFRLSIVEKHKKKHVRVLLISALLMIGLSLAVIYLTY